MDGACSLSCWCCATMALHVLDFVPSEVIISILSILLFLIVIWYLLFLMSGLPSLKCLFLCRLSVLSVWQLLWFLSWESTVEISIVYFYSNICICLTSCFQSLWSQNSKNLFLQFFFSVQFGHYPTTLTCWRDCVPHISVLCELSLAHFCFPLSNCILNKFLFSTLDHLPSTLPSANFAVSLETLSFC